MAEAGESLNVGVTFDSGVTFSHAHVIVTQNIQ